MRVIHVTDIADRLADCVREASFTLGERERAALADARERETNDTARDILDQLLENADIASAERRPLCQDTGVAVVFLDIGRDVRLEGGELEETLRDAVGAVYTDEYLRASMVRHPLDRVNTGDNTPPVVHTRIVPGDGVRIRFCAKGGGCENMSATAMLTPADGRDGVLDFVVSAVRDAGGKPCPPLVVGVGMGGGLEKAALLAKEALLRPLGEPAGNELDAALERDMLERINATGVGPMGLGGRATALAAHVESFPCHIASLPVAVCLNCHSSRHAEAVL